jgi:hypothetical protein
VTCQMCDHPAAAFASPGHRSALQNAALFLTMTTTTAAGIAEKPEIRQAPGPT